jgi:hypothetical protein
MAREKRPYKAFSYGVGSMMMIEPLKDTTETTFGGRVPAIDAVLPDGRRVFVTFEITYGAGTDRAAYTRRMRALAATLLAEADRRDADPKR